MDTTEAGGDGTIGAASSDPNPNPHADSKPPNEQSPQENPLIKEIGSLLDSKLAPLSNNLHILEKQVHTMNSFMGEQILCLKKDIEKEELEIPEDKQEQ